MRPASRYGLALAALDGVDQGRQPVCHIQRGRFARQQVIAQRPQHLGQVAEQDLGGRVFLALTVTVHQRDELVSRRAVRVEIVNGGPGRIGIGFVSHQKDITAS